MCVSDRRSVRMRLIESLWGQTALFLFSTQKISNYIRYCSHQCIHRSTFSLTIVAALLWRILQAKHQFTFPHMKNAQHKTRNTTVLFVFQELLQHQTPDMRSLSMGLPPVPRSDSAEDFLKDAPQENSRLLYCQHSPAATEMKLIWKESCWESVQRNSS